MEHITVGDAKPGDVLHGAGATAGIVCMVLNVSRSRDGKAVLVVEDPLGDTYCLTSPIGSTVTRCDWSSNDWEAFKELKAL